MASSGNPISKVKNQVDLEGWREKLIKQRDPSAKTINVCIGTGCAAKGSRKLYEQFCEAARESGSDVAIEAKSVGCHGFCERGPIVVIQPGDIIYQEVEEPDVSEIFRETVLAGKVIDRLLYENPATGEKAQTVDEIPFYKSQRRIVLSFNGRIDPARIEDYLAIGGYSALAKALSSMSPEQIISEVEISGLRGRGGGGFLTARKWRSCRNAEGAPKYVICNGDEGDPGAFMDRSLMEGNPHSILEGMIIGAYAIGSSQGFIYVRNEYPLAVEHLKTALSQAREAGMLGENILGSSFSFDIRINRGGGAFVCGESTALIASLEGRIGEPRAKYVHTVEHGLHDRPTNLNNVETWANIPHIINKGGGWFASIGTEKSKGTKVFSLVGKVVNTGLVEVPMGMTLRQIVEDIGGGVKDGRALKAVQTGGPSGGCIPAASLDAPVDFDELAKLGSMMGSGGMIVMDEDTCMVNLAKYFLTFLKQESCGKCTPCREGIPQMLYILERISHGEGQEGDLERLEQLAELLAGAALCALGKTAANPVLSTVRYFRDEYHEHI
ncbi:MAG TPA: NADH-ubiquinone oxidoreductase-F iron-sulfur binding region domain-containing protein, partial [Spirochaetia bacterium]|nr:NADH-ubiquinone oxidoreductase-F iron-sulfur binding region domain-containing protein [Spirochaetia bacterium]